MNAHRRAAVDQSLALMSGQVTWAAEAIGDLGKNAASDSVKLAAVKAVFTNLVAISKFARFEDRITGIEERLDAYTGNTALPG